MKRSGFTGPRAEIKRSPIKKRGKRSARKAAATGALRKACRSTWPTCALAAARDLFPKPALARGERSLNMWARGHVCLGGMETAHILGKAAHPSLEFDPDNVITLCHGAHAHFTAHPSDWAMFIERLLPGRWDELLRREQAHLSIGALSIAACPKCLAAGDPQLLSGGNTSQIYFVGCMNCGRCGPAKIDDKEAAISAWNAGEEAL